MWTAGRVMESNWSKLWTYHGSIRVQGSIRLVWLQSNVEHVCVFVWRCWQFVWNNCSGSAHRKRGSVYDKPIHTHAIPLDQSSSYQTCLSRITIIALSVLHLQHSLHPLELDESNLISKGNRFPASGKTVPARPLDVSVDVLSSYEKWWASGSVGCWYSSLRIGWRSSENDCRQRCRVALESSLPQKSIVEMWCQEDYNEN